MAISQQRQPQYSYATGPYTIVVTWIHSGQLADDCGFLRPSSSDRFWRVHKHGSFSITRKTLGLRPADQNCHHETWLHVDIVDWNNRWSKHDDYDRHISLTERPADYSYGTQKLLIVGTNSCTNLKAKARDQGSRKPN